MNTTLARLQRRLADDGRIPKHTGANQSDFNANFKTLSSLIKSVFVWCMNFIDIKMRGKTIKKYLQELHWG